MKGIGKRTQSTGSDLSQPGSGLSWPDGQRLLTLLTHLAMSLEVVFLAGFVVWYAFVTGRSVESASRSNVISEHYQHARLSAVIEESLEREYRLEPSPAVRAQFENAAADLIQTLDRVAQLGTKDDRALIERIRSNHDRFLELTFSMFDAVNVGDVLVVQSLDHESEAIFLRVEQAIEQAASEHRDHAQSEMKGLAETQQLVWLSTPLVLLVGFIILTAYTVVIRAQRRRLATAQRIAVAGELARLAAVAETRALEESEKRFRALVQNGADLIAILDFEGIIRYHSPSAEVVLGYRAEQLIGRALAAFVPPDEAAIVRSVIKASLAKPGSPIIAELRMQHASTGWRHLETIATALPDYPGIEGILLTSRDITVRKTLEDRLTDQAFHDALTGLPNRKLFMDRLTHAVNSASRDGNTIAVLFMDLDDFKFVNDTLGHSAGDSLLIGVAERIRNGIRTGDTVARLGGDEFAVLLDGIEGEADAIQVAERVAASIRRPLDLDGREVYVSLSIGIACRGEELESPDDLLRNADAAMYEVKHNGKAGHSVYRPEISVRAWKRLDLERDLHRAVENNEFVVEYQPIVNLATHQIVELEALVRWQHPEHGRIGPDAFIPLAEENGLIIPIGRRVLTEACRQLKSWQETYPADPPLTLAVNLSPRQCGQPMAAEEIIEIVHRAGIEPSSLTLEITERTMLHDSDRVVAMFTQLKDAGIRLAVDDFGTGYSSLSYLQRFPIDILKIDKTFVDRLKRHEEAPVIVEAIIGLARSLGLQVTAEGVETVEQYRQLAGAGGDFGQGFYFAKPQAATAIAALLDPGRRLRNIDPEALSLPAA